jgi:transcriptional regulator with XRE-family HTH domain
VLNFPDTMPVPDHSTSALSCGRLVVNQTVVASYEGRSPDITVIPIKGPLIYHTGHIKSTPTAFRVFESGYATATFCRYSLNINMEGWMQTKKLLGMRIRELRKTRHMTQERLAEKVGVEPKQISRIEGGKSFPSMDTLESIARSLQVEMKDLLNFQHLTEENLESELLKIFGMMDDKTKRMTIRMLRSIVM